MLRLVGRDCGLCRNPFNANKKTLHIFIEKENIIGNSFDKEFVRHADTENAIPAGHLWDFRQAQIIIILQELKFLKNMTTFAEIFCKHPLIY